MWSRGIIIAAVAAYAGILGCVMWSNNTPAGYPSAYAESSAPSRSAPLSGLPYRAISLQIHDADKIEQYKNDIDEIADVGADAILLVVHAQQENGASGRIYLDMRQTPSPQGLTELIGRAKQHNLRVILMPIVLLDNPRGNEWRGTLNPESWREWFESYRSMISHFARIAQAQGVNVLVIGSELVSAEAHVDEWTKTIRTVRDIFKGQITYSSNWDHYTSVAFWDQLDLVGMNSYWKLGKDHTVSIEQIQANWREIQKDLLGFLNKVGKPLLFLEAGWCSLQNAAHESWDYTKDLPVDLELQRKLYEGFFRSWHGNPSLAGFAIWEWSSGEGGAKDSSYTPENKPAEKTLREWLAKPGWEVK